MGMRSRTAIAIFHRRDMCTLSRAVLSSADARPSDGPSQLNWPARGLLNLGFRQKQTRELLGQRYINMAEVAQIIGRAIGKPDLRYSQAPDEQVRACLDPAWHVFQYGRSYSGDVSRFELRLHASFGAALGKEHHADLLRNVCGGGIRSAL